MLKPMKMIMGENQSSQLQVHFGVLRVKRQKASLNRQPIAYTHWGGGSVLMQQQSHDTEMDGQRNTQDGYQAGLVHC
jgi:hypothetical protein